MGGMMPVRRVWWRGVEYHIYPNGLALPVIAGAGDFTKTTWNEGAAPGISAAELNRIEAGIDEAIRILNRDLSQVEVVNTVAETNIYTFSIPAGTLGATGGVRLTIGGDMLQNATGDLTVRIKLGATTVLDSGQVTVAKDADRYKWELEVWFLNSVAAAQKWTAKMKAVQKDAVNFASQQGGSNRILLFAGFASSSEDTALARTIAVTIQWSVISTSTSFRKEMAMLEKLPAT